MKKLFLAICFLFLVVMLSGVEASFADDSCIPKQPSPPHLVNNFSKQFPDFLSAGETATLEQKLDAFDDSTSNQILIVIVDDLCGYDVNEFSTRLGQAWGVGHGKFNNGVVVLVKPTGGAGQRAAYIAVGYGLEGIIPDITAKQIVDNEILPRFKNQDNFGALDASTNVLISLAKKEFSSDEYARHNSSGNFPWLIIGFVIIFILISIFNSRKPGYTVGRGRTAYYGGMFGGGFFGGGGFGGGGGSSGGGFGGFGGGSFGGGGAGGSW